MKQTQEVHLLEIKFKDQQIARLEDELLRAQREASIAQTRHVQTLEDTVESLKKQIADTNAVIDEIGRDVRTPEFLSGLRKLLAAIGNDVRERGE